jgi:hypothetical protein
VNPPNKVDRRARLRAARFQDYQQIAALEARYGLGALSDKSYEKWIHLWQGNPAYRELQSDWSIGWVLEGENGQIVGSMGNIPLQYEFDGKKILAASGRGWVVEPDYRSAAFLLLDHVINQRGVDLYLNNTVSSTSLAGVEFFNCERVPVGLWDEWAVWITDYPSFSESVIAMKNYPFAKVLRYPLSAGLFLKDRLKRSAVRESDVEICSCLSFDDRFDTFWTNLKAKNPRLLLAVRTVEALEWHFRFALSNSRLWIATIVDGSRLVAYAIFDRKDTSSLGLKRMRLVDFQSLEGTGFLVPILAWALKKCAAQGLHALINVGRYFDERAFIESASFRWKLPAWTFFYRVSDPILAGSLREGRAWAPSLFDGDASL